MKVLFVCTGKYNDIKNWSGTVKSIANTLEEISDEIKYVDELKENTIIKLIYKILNKISKKKFLLTRDIFIAKSYARQVKKRSEGFNYDLIFTTSSLPVAFLESKKPIYFYTDATFENMIDYYESFSNLSYISKTIGNYIEQKSIHNVTCSIYASEWAANSALNYYGAYEDKVKVVNFGLNMDNDLTEQLIKEMIKKRLKDEEIKLFFMGVDFKRKGGDLALKIVKKINDKGYKCKLFISGCEVDLDDEYKKYVEVLGYLNKDIDKDREKINKLYSDSHFFILPTRNEAYGIVFAEASSYGLPSITTSTGGVNSVIADDKNGYCLSINSDESEYANLIIDIFKNKERYENLCIKSYNEYKNRLNWNEVSKKLKIIRDRNS